MHRLTHLHAVCPSRPDSAAGLLPFQVQTKTRGGGTNPGDGACGPWGSLLPPHAPCGCWRWELLWSEGGFSLLHSACVTLPFFSRSTVIRSPQPPEVPAGSRAARLSGCYTLLLPAASSWLRDVRASRSRSGGRSRAPPAAALSGRRQPPAQPALLASEQSCLLLSLDLCFPAFVSWIIKISSLLVKSSAGNVLLYF